MLRASPLAHIVQARRAARCASICTAAWLTRARPWLPRRTQAESKALSPHTAGEPPHPRAVAVARELGLRISAAKTAVPFDEGVDIVHFDLVVVMDRFDQ